MILLSSGIAPLQWSIDSFRLRPFPNSKNHWPNPPKEHETASGPRTVGWLQPPDNIQGIHRLIIHYTFARPEIDTTLLERRLMNVSKKYNRIEAMIRSYYLSRVKRYDEVISFLDKWHSEANNVTITLLVKAHIMGEMRLYRKRRQVLSEFKIANNGREDIMKSKMKEFGTIFGENATRRLKKLLHFSPPKRT